MDDEIQLLPLTTASYNNTTNNNNNNTNASFYPWQVQHSEERAALNSLIQLLVSRASALPPPTLLPSKIVWQIPLGTFLELELVVIFYEMAGHG